MSNIVTFAQLGRFGRFANGCFQVAATIGIARMNGFDWALPYWQNYNGRDFEPDLDIDCQKEFVNPLPLYDGPELPQWGVAFGWHPDRIKLPHSVDLHGHFQSDKYFKHAIDEVRYYFTMKDEPPLSDYCAIHWRAGDYGEQPTVWKPQGNPFHPRMNETYYGPAIEQFPADQKFLVFSDNIEGAKAMFGESDRFMYSEGRNYFDDFRLLKTCKHFIVANSSYSMFAAIIADQPDKKIIAPEPWFGGAYAGTLPEKDIYPEGCTIINYQTRQINRAA